MKSIGERIYKNRERCAQVWFVFAAAYLYFGSGTSWKLVFSKALYSSKTNELVALLSWVELVLIVFFILMTVRAFRSSKLNFSKGAHITLASVCGVAFVMQSISNWLFSTVCLHLLCGGDKIQYAHLFSKQEML